MSYALRSGRHVREGFIAFPLHDHSARFSNPQIHPKPQPHFSFSDHHLVLQSFQRPYISAFRCPNLSRGFFSPRVARRRVCWSGHPSSELAYTIVREGIYGVIPIVSW